MKKTVMRVFIILFVIGTIFFFVYRTSNTEIAEQKEAVTTIQTVLEHTFTGPEEKLANLWETIDNKEIEDNEVEAALAEWNSYTANNFKPYFTEEFYHSYIASYGENFLQKAHWNGYQLKMSNLEVEKADTKLENIYNFSLTVHYQKEKVVNVTGQANINKDGLITGMEIKGNKLWEELMDIN
ncbi:MULTISPECIES: hypothetical protein [Niallia]|uniref:SnoaL-like domain-containing protein n=1 Tax=Niallia alba TaxID=2729105 RepID=A0A7Y0K4X8_9BACI|nr:hypothetical protein [Niallia alba]NMO75878.1 hypothetical protein [Niallia alba]